MLGKRGGRALCKEMRNDLSNHGKRHLVAYDSAATVGAVVKGRPSSGSIGRELQRTGTYLLTTDSVEGALWCESEHNLADSPSRQGPLPLPAPRRPWVHQFFEGDSEAFVERKGGRIGRVVAEDNTVGSRILPGYNGWVRDLTDDGDVEPHPGPQKGRGRRARSAPRPQRRGIDLRVEALGAETTAARRRRYSRISTRGSQSRGTRLSWRSCRRSQSSTAP